MAVNSLDRAAFNKSMTFLLIISPFYRFLLILFSKDGLVKGKSRGKLFYLWNL